MKEIGGYFGLDESYGHFIVDGVAVNSARNALRYIIRAYNIKEIWAPYYTCPVVWEVLTAESLDVYFYNINENLFPMISNAPRDAFILVNNYFGVCGKNIQKLAQIYPNLIVDNAQAFYSPHITFADFSSPRKFFGLPDGGIARCATKLSQDLPTSISWNRCSHLLKRADCGAEAGYADFSENDESLIGVPVKSMSNLTKQMLENIDYDGAREIRLQNFEYLHQYLGSSNLLKIDLADTDVPLVYPYLANNQDLRTKLIDNKIFIAKYWGGIEDVLTTNVYEVFLLYHLVALPIDQRYNIEDMKRILGVLNDKD